MSALLDKRKRAGLRLADVAHQSKINFHKLWRIERDKQLLHVDDAIILAPILKCEVVDLLPQLAAAMSHQSDCAPSACIPDLHLPLHAQETLPESSEV